MAKVITGVFPETATENKDKAIPGYVLHISLAFSDPLIWRRVQVPGTITLATFHDVIQLSMGWDDSNFHQFLVGKISYEPTSGDSIIRESTKYDERNAQLHDLEEGMGFMFTYLYDAGEGWEHQIYLEEVVPYTRELRYPVLLSGEQACPPETFGDIHDYQALLYSLENSPGSSQVKLLELTGSSDFDADYFDLNAAKVRLQALQ